MKDVHTEHCCRTCGCKYGDDHPQTDPETGEEWIACTVVSGHRMQSFECGKTSVCWDTNLAYADGIYEAEELGDC